MDEWPEKKRVDLYRIKLIENKIKMIKGVIKRNNYLEIKHYLDTSMAISLEDELKHLEKRLNNGASEFESSWETKISIK